MRGLSKLRLAELADGRRTYSGVYPCLTRVETDRLPLIVVTTIHTICPVDSLPILMINLERFLGF